MGTNAVTQRLLAADAALTVRINGLARSSVPARTSTIVAATWLAGVEVSLMGLVFLAGRRRDAARMLVAVTLVYAASEVLGLLWPRTRPYEALPDVEALVPHAAQRSFPSRHVASGLAMAALGQRAHPRLGQGMAAVAWLLGLSRIAAGLHYPSDVLAGAVLGIAVGRGLSRAVMPAGWRRR